MKDNEFENDPDTETLARIRKQDYPTEKLKRLLEYPMPRFKRSGLINWERFSEMEEEDFQRLEQRHERQERKEKSKPLDVVDFMTNAEAFWLGRSNRSRAW